MGPGGEPEGKEKRARKVLRRTLLALLLAAAAWLVPWIALRPWLPAWVSVPAAAAFGGGVILLAFRRRGAWPRGAAALVAAGILGACLEPVPAGGEWIEAHARVPRVRVEGDRVRIEGFRDFRWRTEADRDASWRTEEFDLAAVERCWLAIVPLGADGIVAHTMLLFSFRDGKALALSVEARRRPGQEYDPLRGVLHSYPLIYVLADPRDAFGLRARAWGDRIDLLPLRPDRERTRAVLRDALGRAAELERSGSFYNSVVDNCTTTLARHASGAVRLEWSFRRIVNGRVGAYAHASGLVDTDLPWDSVKDRYRSEERIRTADERDLAAWMRGATGAE